MGLLARELRIVADTDASLTFAYDNGWWGSALGEKAFNVYYGEDVAKDGTPTLSASQQSYGTYVYSSTAAGHN